MPNRILRDWTDSEAVNSLSWQAEVMFTRLIMKVDDFGRFSANPRLLRSLLFPLKDGLRDADMTRFLAECEKAGMVAVYESEGKSFLEIRNFKQRTRSEKSLYPQPNDSQLAVKRLTDDGQMTVKRLTNDGLDGDGDGDGVVCEDEDGGRVTAPRRSSAYLLDEEFWSEMRRHYPGIDVDAESRKMDAWLLAHPGRKKTRQFVINWLNKVEPTLAPAKAKEVDLTW